MGVAPALLVAGSRIRWRGNTKTNRAGPWPPGFRAGLDQCVHQALAGTSVKRCPRGSASSRRAVQQRGCRRPAPSGARRADGGAHAHTTRQVRPRRSEQLWRPQHGPRRSSRSRSSGWFRLSSARVSCNARGVVVGRAGGPQLRERLAHFVLAAAPIFKPGQR